MTCPLWRRRRRSDQIPCEHLRNLDSPGFHVALFSPTPWLWRWSLPAKLYIPCVVGISISINDIISFFKAIKFVYFKSEWTRGANANNEKIKNFSQVLPNRIDKYGRQNLYKKTGPTCARWMEKEGPQRSTWASRLPSLASSGSLIFTSTPVWAFIAFNVQPCFPKEIAHSVIQNTAHVRKFVAKNYKQFFSFFLVPKIRVDAESWVKNAKSFPVDCRLFYDKITALQRLLNLVYSTLPYFL